MLEFEHNQKQSVQTQNWIIQLKIYRINDKFVKLPIVLRSRCITSIDQNLSEVK